VCYAGSAATGRPPGPPLFFRPRRCVTPHHRRLRIWGAPRPRFRATRSASRVLSDPAFVITELATEAMTLTAAAHRRTPRDAHRSATRGPAERRPASSNGRARPAGAARLARGAAGQHARAESDQRGQPAMTTLDDARPGTPRRARLAVALQRGRGSAPSRGSCSSPCRVAGVSTSTGETTAADEQRAYMLRAAGACWGVEPSASVAQSEPARIGRDGAATLVVCLRPGGGPRYPQAGRCCEGPWS
jgi:hypothetical protein